MEPCPLVTSAPCCHCLSLRHVCSYVPALSGIRSPLHSRFTPPTHLISSFACAHDVPAIGLVSASVGGSAIEFWTSTEARADGNVKSGTCGGSTAKLAEGCLQSRTAMDVSSSRSAAGEDVGGWAPGCFFNAMISPFQYMALRGILWDQGEANYGDDCLTYGCKLSALAHDWRTNLFNQSEILFTFDQLRADAMAQGTGAPSYADAIPHSTFSSRVDLQTCFSNDTSSGHAIRKLEVRS